ncbi:hypothetical protein Hbl1158_13570 [Halobaculum sp. CBA1158]|uniref:hypothetical protein n=1 Tax=Halobaculum sp. CBA1158 TaxID=2904243 RepID=UPI001F43552E|nr:hypothetical protein [Halobaculum sp. CBA1158]UIO99537.1 hypothetical protein Hbl1158_13570 [Halobaculum sp. CBA1158]
MVSALLNTVYSAVVLIVALVGLVVVLRASGEGSDGTIRMELTTVAVALFVIGLVASTLGYI